MFLIEALTHLIHLGLIPPDLQINDFLNRSLQEASQLGAELHPEVRPR